MRASGFGDLHLALNDVSGTVEVGRQTDGRRPEEAGKGAALSQEGFCKICKKS